MSVALAALLVACVHFVQVQAVPSKQPQNSRGQLAQRLQRAKPPQSVPKNEPIFELPHRGCFYPDDAAFYNGTQRFMAKDLDPSLCTYIVVPCGKITEDGRLRLLNNRRDKDLFRDLNQYKKDFPNLKILLSVGGKERTNQLSEMGDRAKGLETLALSAVKMLRYWKVDGLDIYWDWEVSAFRSDEVLIPTLLQILRQVFDQESVKGNKVRLILSTTLQEASQTASINGPVTGAAADIVNAVSYDQGNTAFATLSIAHHSPLFGGPMGTPSKVNMANVLEEWNRAGIPKSKLVAGIPMYGRGWLLENADEHYLGNPSSEDDLESAYTKSPGQWPFYEICQRIESDNATVEDDKRIAASYAYTDAWWVGYNNQVTIRGKVKWVKENGFGGVYASDVSQDDFMGACGVKNPLMNSIKEESSGTVQKGQA
ncbi:putative Acidic mammalian chitinase [Hypsibius exemplaris]|uniref:Acidic mammalian chitinase n=1 Tax=Hypsibius exemplaris TaxID=2072580 RepID=A0A9X6NA50_HYPEX|nr:putative Acidic mammalian chitinase [Hypsibius exemplaris]